MQIAVTYKQKIKDIKAVLGLSQAQIANLIGTIPQNVSKWALGVYVPNIEHAEKIDKLYQVALDNER